MFVERIRNAEIYRLAIHANSTKKGLRPTLFLVITFDKPLQQDLPRPVRQDIANYLEYSVCRSDFTEADLLLVCKQRPIMHWTVQIGQGKEKMQIQIEKPNECNIGKFFLPPETKKVTLRVAPPPQGLEGALDISVYGYEEISLGEKLLNRGILIGYRISSIIKQFMLDEKYVSKWQQLGPWFEASHIITSTNSIEQILHAIIQLLADWFNSRSAVFLIDQTDNTLIPVIGAGSYDREARRRFKALHGHELFFGHLEALRCGKPLLIRPEDVRKYFPEDVDRFFAVKWAVVAPMVSGSRARGIIQLDRQMAFAEEEIEAIFAIARLSAIAVENAILKEALKRSESIVETVLGLRQQECYWNQPRSNHKCHVTLGSFTARELKVIGLLAKGYSNKEISTELNIAPDTVKVHVHNIYRKLGVRNRSQAMSRLYQLGLVLE